ncbi:TD and POZ domain-containing protein 1-like [Araneus ventricosus]|uniref:TD and POZ domain-containing protein 1-like n=1 Tax=Araneus ventricosus TaxID=182803 RepID=A0A4Y2KHK9_ARAVE|nr:TD and POZ domain-containing protein 1-like [Araneus ventricosus]
MASKTYDETSGCTFQWKIENISHCWLKRQGMIDSPRFIADALEGTKWFLRLYPAGWASENYIGILLCRENVCVGPYSIKVNFQISILDKDGSVLKERIESERHYCKDFTFGCYEYEERGKVFVTEREAFLPKDTLTVQCTIWNTDEKPVKSKHLCARTVFMVKRRNFMWRIDNFSTLKSGLQNKFKDNLIEFDLVLNEGLDFEKKLVININSFDESIKYFSFKISTVDSKGEKENCGNHEYFAGDLKRGILCTILFTKKLMANKSRYLPNDVLSLYCKYVYSTGSVLYEHCGYGVISPDVTNAKVESGNECTIGKEKSQIIPVILNDLKSMYNDQIFSDTELRTSTQAFPAHKNILSARSPVFRKMFSNDMKEKNIGHVDIHDLEDNTVHRMLLFIYTDTLEDMPWEDACKLYAAADKYQILFLRSSCSSFLKDNLCANKACEVLVLADRHQDDDLKSAVQDFILRHDKEVFGSLEWKDFIEANSKLAADMMYRFTLSKIYEP